MEQQGGQRVSPQSEELGRRRRGCPTRTVVTEVTIVIRKHSPDQMAGERKSPDLSLSPPSNLLLLSPSGQSQLEVKKGKMTQSEDQPPSEEGRAD